MSPRRGLSKLNILAGAVVAAAIVGAVIAVVRTDTTGETGNRLGKDYSYDWSDFRKTDPRLIRYAEASTIKIGLTEPRGLALAADGRVLVAGDQAVRVFDGGGKLLSEIKLAAPPQCLAVAVDGTLYVGLRDHVEVLDPEGAPRAAWESPGKDALLSGLALAGEDVYVADGGGRAILHYETSGKLLARIGQRDTKRDIPGLMLPGGSFDIAIGPEGLIWVGNTGLRRVEGYTSRGDLELHWGESTQDIQGFCGCCNPTNLAILADGRFVTSEKGLPRVKVYTREGRFESVVAGPEQFAKDTAGLDLAADAQGRIYVLDPVAKTVRVFAPKEED